MEQVAPICRRSRASDGPALNSPKGMIFPSSPRFSVAGINRTPCHTARPNENVNLLEMTPDPIAQLFAVVTLERTLSVQARGDLKAAAPSIIKAIRHQSGQSAKLESILWSAWNGRLSDALAGLDVNLAVAAVAMIAARAFLAGDADCLLGQIIRESGTQPPAVMGIPDSGHAG